MNGPIVLESYRAELASELASGTAAAVPAYRPLPISPWMAMSLLQKAIRRGREELALGAAATLLSTSPDRLWRRICVTAFEDIGLAEFQLVGLATAALKGKAWRAEHGGEWRVASYLVVRMAQAAKCRAADDVTVVAERQGISEPSLLALAFRPVPDLLKVALSDLPIADRALALWYAVGTDRSTSPLLRERRGEPQAVFAGLVAAGVPASVVEIAREGWRRTGEIMCPILALLWRETASQVATIEGDQLPPERMFGLLPCWVLDMHVREGNAALRRLLSVDCPTVRWINKAVKPDQRLPLLKDSLFWVESGLVASRLHWSVGDKVRQQAQLLFPGVAAADVVCAADLLRGDLPILNDMRRDVLRAG